MELPDFLMYFGLILFSCGALLVVLRELLR
jgi:hypothetical protein